MNLKNMNLIDELTGDNYKNPSKEYQKYNVYIQFDEEQPLLLSKGVKMNESLHIEIKKGVKNHESICFICPTSGKKFTIFAK